MTTASETNVVVVPGEWTGPGRNIDADSQPFWDGIDAHKFLLFHCGQCGAWYWPRAYCIKHDVGPYCEGMEWEEASGRGKIFAFNVHHWVFNAAFKDLVPYVYAVVELDEGPLISSTILDISSSAECKVGDAVEIVYEDHPDEGFTLPRFRLIK